MPAWSKQQKLRRQPFGYELEGDGALRIVSFLCRSPTHVARYPRQATGALAGKVSASILRLPKSRSQFAEESLDLWSLGDQQFVAKFPDTGVDGVNFQGPEDSKSKLTDERRSYNTEIAVVHKDIDSQIIERRVRKITEIVVFPPWAFCR